MRHKKIIYTVIPAFNEEHTVGDIVTKVLLNKKIHACIVVDDGSVDNTSQNASKAGAIILKNSTNIGAGPSLKLGVSAAIERDADIIITMDADGQHCPIDLNRILNALSTNIDMVIGSRYVNPTKNSTSYVRIIGTKIISSLICWIYKKRIYDVTSGYRAMNKQTSRFIIRNFPTVFPEPEIILALLDQRFIIREIPIHMKKRQFGKSSINFFMACHLFLYICTKILTVHIYNHKD